MTLDVDRLPPEIRDSRRAVVWKYEERDGRQIATGEAALAQYRRSE